MKSKNYFDPFGIGLPPINSTDNRIKYTDQERDTFTNYDYMHFRFYASSMGRFLKPDNIIPDITNPQNWNAYTYVKGNPVNFNDPSGHLDERDYSTAGSSESGIALDNGELGGWADDIGDTVSNTKYQLMKAGFSKKAVERAVKEGNLKPIIKTYVVHGGGKYGGNIAISATLGGESIWWSHGGDASLYGRMNAEESEKYFLSIYLNKKETIDVFTLNLSLEESVRVASEINKRIDYSEIPATAKKQYEFKPEILYVCTTSTSEILFQAGIVSIIMPLKSVPFVYWPNTSKKVYESLSEKHETFIPSN